jgi:hypothetical protein
MHDIFLSRAAVRAHAYDELGRWLAAYVDADLDVDPPVNPVETPPPTS